MKKLIILVVLVALLAPIRPVAAQIATSTSPTAVTTEQALISALNQLIKILTTQIAVLQNQLMTKLAETNMRVDEVNTKVDNIVTYTVPQNEDGTFTTPITPTVPVIPEIINTPPAAKPQKYLALVHTTKQDTQAGIEMSPKLIFELKNLSEKQVSVTGVDVSMLVCSNGTSQFCYDSYLFGSEYTFTGVSQKTLVRIAGGLMEIRLGTPITIKPGESSVFTLNVDRINNPTKETYIHAGTKKAYFSVEDVAISETISFSTPIENI